MNPIIKVTSLPRPKTVTEFSVGTLLEFTYDGFGGTEKGDSVVGVVGQDEKANKIFIPLESENKDDHPFHCWILKKQMCGTFREFFGKIEISS
jgi:hypothetical protein